MLKRIRLKKKSVAARTATAHLKRITKITNTKLIKGSRKGHR